MKSYLASKQFAKTVLMASVLAMTPQLRAADWALPITGNLLGTVLDGSGTPQTGASVKLLNKYDRVVAKTLSASDGRFAFAGLVPDFYSLRVSLESFVPAVRDKIAIRAGTNSMLQINLATLFSSIQLNSTIPVGAMSSDWKWVLRSSPATRPITRLLPDEQSVSNTKPRLFSGTRMQVGVSGGDAGLVDNDSVGSDLGTQFALSTNLYGKNALQVAGRLGQNAYSGANAMSICAIYSPSSTFGFANAPEIALTVSQVRMMPATQGTAEGSLMMRNMSLSLYETIDPLDSLHIEYGITGESVDFLQHSARVSPFARVTATLGKAGTLVAAYSDGGRPDELTNHALSQNQEPENVLDGDLAAPVNALARAPQVSLRDDRLELQRTENFEAGFSKTLGSRTYSFSSFYERVSNGRINVAGDLSALDSGSILSDGVSKTSTYNIGNYSRDGYLASVDQKFDESVAVQMAFGRMGAFTASDNLLPGINSKADFLTSKNHNVASIGIRAHVPKTGTRLSARYGWADPRSSIPDHTFTTQNITLATGLNVVIRQPLPSFFGFAGRWELVGDLRNMLSQGYLPLNTADGQRLLIVQSPKAIRGGVSITF